MADELHLDEFQAYLLAEDRSPVTITGYVGDVRLFALCSRNKIRIRWRRIT